MDDKGYYSRTLEFQKTATDNAFALLSILQSSQDELLKKTLDHCTWMPDFGKQGFSIWSTGCQSTTTTIKDAINRSYENIEKLMGDADTLFSTDTPAATKPKTQKPVKRQAKKATSTPAKSRRKASTTKTTTGASAQVKKVATKSKAKPTSTKTVTQANKPVVKSAAPATKPVPSNSTTKMHSSTPAKVEKQVSKDTSKENISSIQKATQSTKK